MSVVLFSVVLIDSISNDTWHTKTWIFVRFILLFFFLLLVRFDTSLYVCDSTNYQIISDKNVHMMDGNTSLEPTIFSTIPYFVSTSDLLASSHTILLFESPKKISTNHKEYICCELVHCYCLCSLNFCVEKQSTRRLIFFFFEFIVFERSDHMS